MIAWKVQEFLGGAPASDIGVKTWAGCCENMQEKQTSLF